MDFSSIDFVLDKLKAAFPRKEFDVFSGLQSQIIVNTDDVLVVSDFLYNNPELYFDFLNCITGVDNGVEAGTFDVLYHISSVALGHNVVLKCSLSRDLGDKFELSSVSSIWKSADWLEREIFDLFGLRFNNHPDLRRILMPADWQGYPLRKDYEEQKNYHSIKVKY